MSLCRPVFIRFSEMLRTWFQSVHFIPPFVRLQSQLTTNSFTGVQISFLLQRHTTLLTRNEQIKSAPNVYAMLQPQILQKASLPVGIVAGLVVAFVALVGPLLILCRHFGLRRCLRPEPINVMASFIPYFVAERELNTIVG